MRKETVLERISKAQETITKKQNTITKKESQIQKKIKKLQELGFTYTGEETKGTMILQELGFDRETANDIFWLQCDIDSLQGDIRRGTKEIEEKKKSLAGYEEELQSIEEKEASRNIKVIIDFLEMWKEQVKNFYIGSVDDWKVTLEEYHKENSKYIDWYNSNFHDRQNKELDSKMKQPMNEAKKRHAMYNFLDRYMNRTNGDYTMNMELLRKDLDEEANAKYDFIIERTNKIVGQITDASNLSIGQKGDLNGYIIGTKGIAKVQTIGAGGWNIQCYHFRTLINKM